MAKIKFDRVLSITTKPGEKITVPSDEIWKGSVLYTSTLYVNGNFIESIYSASSNGKYLFNPILPNTILGGVRFFTQVVITTEQFLQGLPLRLYNKLAKGVSLA